MVWLGVAHVRVRVVARGPRRSRARSPRPSSKRSPALTAVPSPNEPGQADGPGRRPPAGRRALPPARLPHAHGAAVRLVRGGLRRRGAPTREAGPRRSGATRRRRRRRHLPGRDGGLDRETRGAAQPAKQQHYDFVSSAPGQRASPPRSTPRRMACRRSCSISDVPGGQASYTSRSRTSSGSRRDRRRRARAAGGAAGGEVRRRARCSCAASAEAG